MKSNIRDALETRLSVNSYLWPKNTDPYEFIETILKAGIKNIGLHTDFIEVLKFTHLKFIYQKKINLHGKLQKLQVIILN